MARGMPWRMSLPNHGYTGPVLPRPIIRSMRPSEMTWSIAYSSARRTGSFVVIRVVAVDRVMFLVTPAR